IKKAQRSIIDDIKVNFAEPADKILFRAFADACESYSYKREPVYFSDQKALQAIERGWCQLTTKEHRPSCEKIDIEATVAEPLVVLALFDWYRTDQRASQILTQTVFWPRATSFHGL